jgi:chitinase
MRSYWKKDYIKDANGTTIATATPLPSDTTAPSTPTGLTHSTLTQAEVGLYWNASTDTGGSGLAGYKIYRGNLPIGATASTSFFDPSLTADTSYSYKLS